MRVFLRYLRRAIRFTLAAFLWLHTLFVLHVQPPNFSKLGAPLHLTGSELAVFVLLFGFSVLTGYGYGNLSVDLLYVYFFPFVLLFTVVRWMLGALLRLNRWITAGASIDSPISAIKLVAPPETINNEQALPSAPKQPRWRATFIAVAKPLRRFTFLWFFLLAITTHEMLMRIALAIVLIHVAFALVAVLRFTVFSASVLSQLEDKITHYAEGLIAKIQSVNRDTDPSQELRNTWVSVTALLVGMRVLQNKQVISRWAILLGAVFLGCIYLYLSTLFSFAYYGIAKVQGVTYPWFESFVYSLFLPLTYSDLPQNVWIKLLAGIQSVVTLVVGIGTVVNYLLRKTTELHAAATTITVRFADESIHEKLEILDQKFKPAQPTVAPK